MPPVVNHDSRTILVARDTYRLKSFFLPLRVPVLVLGLAHLIADADLLKGEILNGLLQGCFVEERLLHIAQQTGCRFLETLKPYFSRQRCQYVAGIGRVGGQTECYLVIFHIGC